MHVSSRRTAVRRLTGNSQGTHSERKQPGGAGDNPAPPGSLLVKGALLAGLRGEAPKHLNRRCEIVLGQAARERV